MSVRTAWLLPGGSGEGQTRADTRLAPLGTMVPTGELTSRGGVIPGGDPFALVSTGAMSATAGIGRAVVQGTTAQGAYPVAVDAPEPLAFGDGDAQFGRVDSVILHVYDGLYDISGETIARPEVLVGEPSADPQPPTLPPACERLHDVLVPAGTSAGVGGIDWNSAVTDRRRYTVAAGAVIPRGTLSDAGAHDGQYADVGGVLYRWSAGDGAWSVYRPPLNIEEIATGFVAASGYVVTEFEAWRGGGMAGFVVQVTRTGAQLNVPAAGNIEDETIGTLPAGYRPRADHEAEASDGYGQGAVRVKATGDLQLRVWTGGGALINDRNIRTSGTFFHA